MCSMLSDKPLEINIVVVKFSACLLYEKEKVPSTMTTQRVKNKQKYFRKIAKTFFKYSWGAKFLKFLSFSPTFQ